jgi:hypothetical protein
MLGADIEAFWKEYVNVHPYPAAPIRPSLFRVSGLEREGEVRSLRTEPHKAETNMAMYDLNS